jgi:acyl-CoA synthetase (AMP-forming)/AMP-acid ligase II
LRWCLPELRRIPHAFVAGHWPGACALGAAASLPMFATPAACDRDSVALVSFTSGTTGRPKGVLRTHSVLVATQQALARELELREGETHLSVLPFVVLANLGAGVTSVLPDGNLMRLAQLDPARLAAQIRAHHVDVVVASPTVADRLATHATATRAFDSVRRVYLGGAPVLPPLLDRWRSAAPGARITVLYGATEAEPIASLRADRYGDAERRATRDGAGVLVGSPVPDVDVRILADHHGTPVGPCTEAEFAALSLAPGVEGEIVVTGPHVAPGYLDGAGNLLARVEVAARRWHRTGDAGYLDSSGRLWLTGRCANRIALGAGGIHALRIEAALADEPAVARAAFFQHGDQRLLVIEPAEPGKRLPLDQIAAQIAFASPEAIAVIERMPMDARHAAKIDYRRLEHDVTAGQAPVQWPHPRGGP